MQLNSNVHYSFVAYVKLLSMAPGHNYHAAEAILTCQDSHGNIVAFIFRLLCIMEFMISTLSLYFFLLNMTTMSN